MAFVIDTFDLLEFDIPAAEGTGRVRIKIPPVDCVSKTDLDAIHSGMSDEVKSELGVEYIRGFLLHFNTGEEETAAIKALVPRQVLQINTIVSEQSEANLGESEPSADS
ncbi:hypothetical protein CMUST_15715 (plasmid) [Corynebacterium mustelae]|uniref:Uncharacterized protein n=1 Tax=Corynebacterium mustelae TaxID=571915 RepID=A0A0G3H0A5_9CORY|nr:hypothetical protein [Corynebacterium mustelae]AKK05243.1 hypothetical protein CMUST_04505 [Corynebacterium mustelae]AKK07431.1 hypothetical protein CMUST_15715 [Corynebacterium mustelae]